MCQVKSSLISSVLYLTPYLGWTIFDKLYILNGTVYIVSNDPNDIPDVRYMYSKGIDITNEDHDRRLPTASDIQVITAKEAAKLFGTGAHIIDGVSVRSTRSLLCLSLLNYISSLSMTHRNCDYLLYMYMIASHFFSVSPITTTGRQNSGSAFGGRTPLLTSKSHPTATPTYLLRAVFCSTVSITRTGATMPQ